MNQPAANGPTVAFDEFGPLELRPHAGHAWRTSGHPQRQRATYTRPHGVRHWLAFYDVHGDELWGYVRPRKRRQETLDVLKRLRRRYPQRQRIHLILDNFSPHGTPEVRSWCRRNNVHLIWTPTNASWLNPIECQFTPVKEFVIFNSDPGSHREQATALRRYAAYRNRYAREKWWNLFGNGTRPNDQHAVVRVELLLANGADINAKSESGLVPLHCVSREDVAELLIKAGADTSASDDSGRTPLVIAESRKLDKVVQVLKAAGGTAPDSVEAALVPEASDPRLVLELWGNLLTMRGTPLEKGKGADDSAGQGTLVGTVKTPYGPAKVAVDCTGPQNDKPDVVRLDFANGASLGSTVKVALGKDGMFTTDTRVDIGGQPIPVRLVGQCQLRPSGYFLSVLMGTGAVAQCDLGGKHFSVHILDGDGNLKLGDMPLNLGQIACKLGDKVLIKATEPTTGEQLGTGRYGNPVFVGGEWYGVTITNGGSSMRLRRVKIQAGTIHVDHAGWSALLLGRKYVLSLTGGPEPVHVPADDYAIVQYLEVRRQPGKMPAVLTSSSLYETSTKELAKVAAGQNVEVRVGSPLQGRLAAKQEDGSVHFTLECLDAFGNAVELISIPEAEQPKEPTLQIFDQAGNSLFMSKMKRERRYGATCSWTPAANLVGSFRASVSLDISPFDFACGDLTFAVKATDK